MVYYEKIKDVFKKLSLDDFMLGEKTPFGGKLYKKIDDFSDILASPNYKLYSETSLTPPSSLMREDEFETLIHRPRGMLQPRSGPHFREDRFGGYRSIERRGGRNESPSFQGRRLRKELENGIIPDAVHETYHLINPNDPAAIAFEEKMIAITDRLFKGNYGAKTRDFRFVLSDSDDMEGCILTGAKPPIVVLSKAVFEKCETEDEVAALLAHELTHQHIFDRIGAHESSNPEESSSDGWAVHLLQEAGYNPNAMLSMLEKLHPDHMKQRKTAIEASEPHPSYPTRRRHVEDVLAYFESKMPLNSALTPLDDSLKEVIASASHRGVVERYLEGENYEAADASAKIAILCKLWDSGLSRDSFDEHKTRFDDFEEVVGELAESLKATPRMLDPLVQRLFMVQVPEFMKGDMYETNYKNDRIDSLYQTLSAGYGVRQYKENGWTPIGPLSDLKNAMTCFMLAETAEEAQGYATTINSMGALFDFSRSPLVTGTRWPDFKIPHLLDLDKDIEGGKACYFPWHRLQQWSEDSQDIRQALARFNINGADAPRLLPSQKSFFSDIQWSYFGYTPDKHLVFADDGRITAHTIKRTAREAPKVERFSTHYDANYLRARDEEAEGLLKTVDWGLLERDFFGFVKQYKNQLMPQITVSDGGDLFQKAFCDKCRELARKDPSTFKPLLATFFIGDPAETAEARDRKDTFPTLLRETFWVKQYSMTSKMNII